MSMINKLSDKELQEIASWPEYRRDAYEERAAILEYDAGFSRDEAERLAYVDISNDMLDMLPLGNK
jgi:hypothetical protein